MQRRIDECFIKVSELQVKENTDTRFPKGFIEKKGLYESWVHFHVKGGLKERIIRNQFRLYDNNYFVTAWVLITLLESNNFGYIDDISDQLQNSIDQLMNFRDKNNPNSSIISFWQQEGYNPVKNLYYCYPEGIATIIEIVSDVMELILKIARYIGFEDAVDRFLKKYNLEGIFGHIEKIIAALHIPPDTDDSSLNLSLGCMLNDYTDKSNKIPYGIWKNRNSISSIERFLEKCIKYAYKPFGSDGDSVCTEIDPRSYYFMYQYLNKKAGEGNISLLTTWLTKREETINMAPYVHMPFNVNNVDVSVCANFVNALAQYAVSFPGEMEQILGRLPELRKLILDSSDYIKWVITNNKITERPDLGALYYPSVLNSYWFVARTISLLSNQRNLNRLNENSSEVFKKVMQTFDSAMIQSGISTILDMSEKKTIDYDSRSTALFWDDFLGEHDTTICPVNKNEDRVYTSAIALNTLIDICTERTYQNQSNNYTLKWKENISDTIKTSVASGIVGLLRTSNDNTGVFDPLYEKQNAFFSGSVKENSFPLYYPFNVFEPLIAENNEEYSGQVVALKGYLDTAEYNLLLKKFKPPAKYTRYKYSGPFPYWSSPALTYALVINVLSKYCQLIEN